jgi:hypothetical protein
MNTTQNQVSKQIRSAIIEAEDKGRFYSEIDGKWVRRGYGVMSQNSFAEMMEKRNEY